MWKDLGSGSPGVARACGREPDPVAWEQARVTELDGAQVPVNEYFLSQPDHVLGEMGATNGAYRADDLVVTATGDTNLALSRALDALAVQARARGLTWIAAAEPKPGEFSPVAPAAMPSQRPEGYLDAHGDGTFTKVTGGHAVPCEVPRSQAAELRQLLRLRDVVTALLEAEAASLDDTAELDRMRQDLGRRYDTYVRAYGPVNRFSWRHTGRARPQVPAKRKWPASVRRRAGSAPTRLRPSFRRWRNSIPSVSVPPRPRSSPAGSWPPQPAPRCRHSADALAICLDVCGEVRLPGIARLLGVDTGEARVTLARWSSRTRQPASSSPPPSTCPGTSATSCGPPSRPRAKTPVTR